MAAFLVEGRGNEFGILTLDGSKVALKVAAVGLAQRAVGAVALEEVDLVLQVAGTVVLRRGREQPHVGTKCRVRDNVGDELVEGLVHGCPRITKLVALVDKDKAVILLLQGAGKVAAVGIVIFVGLAGLHVVH